MQTYTLLREFADSWVLLAMFSAFVFVILWILRPGSRKIHRDASAIPLRDDYECVDEVAVYKSDKETSSHGKISE